MDASLPGHCMQFRPSMLKLEAGGGLVAGLEGVLGVLAWSSPYRVAKLGKQAVELLGACVDPAILRRLHEECTERGAHMGFSEFF